MEKVKKETRGGYRPGTGRKLKYTEPTQRRVYYIPASLIEKVDQAVENIIKKVRVKKDEK